MAVQTDVANSSLRATSFVIAKFRARALIHCLVGAAATAPCSVSHRWQKQFSSGVVWPVGPRKH
jgi:hypothetical protein